jgi:hypothetical protein
MQLGSRARGPERRYDGWRSVPALQNEWKSLGPTTIGVHLLESVHRDGPRTPQWVPPGNPFNAISSPPSPSPFSISPTLRIVMERYHFHGDAAPCSVCSSRPLRQHHIKYQSCQAVL